MSDPEVQLDKAGGPAVDAESNVDKTASGINLWIVYGLMLVGFLVAIGVAILIVWPFYQRR